MRTFKVEIVEYVTHTYYVEALDGEDAENQATDQFFDAISSPEDWEIANVEEVYGDETD